MEFNREPYFNDYDEDKKHLQMLFKPGKAVQARELTQLQDILQKQVSRLSDFTFKEGSVVIPGAVAYDTSVPFVKVQDTWNGVSVNVYEFMGKTVRANNPDGTGSGITAKVFHVEPATETEPAVLYLKYMDSGFSGEDDEIIRDDYTEIDDDGNTYAKFADKFLEMLDPDLEGSDLGVNFYEDEDGKTVESVGFGSLAFIEEGVYYVKGYMVKVDDQKVVLDRYSSTPSYKVGLEVYEDIVTSEDDQSLLDNARGTTNFQAEGSDRYVIRLVFNKRSLEDEVIINETDLNVNNYEDNFIELMRIEDGEVVRRNDRTDTTFFQDMLAKRTFDLEGNFTVDPFELEVKEFFGENENGGVYTVKDFEYDLEVDAAVVAKERFGLFYIDDTVEFGDNRVGQAFTPSPTEVEEFSSFGFEVGKFYPGDSPKNLIDTLRNYYAIAIDPGKAYVNGYDVETLQVIHLDLKKAIDFESVNNSLIYASQGNYIIVSDMKGLPRPFDDIEFYGTPYLQDVVEGVSVERFMPFYRQDGLNVTNVVARAKVKSVEAMDFGTETADQLYKIHLMDIKTEYHNGMFRSIREVYPMIPNKDAELDGLMYNASSRLKYDFNKDVRSFLITSDYGVDQCWGSVLNTYNLIDMRGYTANAGGKIRNKFVPEVRGIIYGFNPYTSQVLVKHENGYSDASAWGLEAFVPVDLSHYIADKNRPFRVNEFIIFEDNETNEREAAVALSTFINLPFENTIFEFQHPKIKTLSYLDQTLENPVAQSDTNYFVRRVLEGDIINTGDSYSAVFTIPSSKDEYFDHDIMNHIFTYIPSQSTDNLHLNTFDGGSGMIEVSQDGKELKITMSYAQENQRVRVSASVYKAVTKERTKNLVENKLYKTRYSDPYEPVKLDHVELDKADGLALKKVYHMCADYYEKAGDPSANIDMNNDVKAWFDEATLEEIETAAADWKAWEYSDQTGTAPKYKVLDVTSEFKFDNGQRDSYYDIAAVDAVGDAPNGVIAVVYDYFEHTNGDYFSIDSYIHSTSTLKTSEVPFYDGISLCDVIDFRPVMVKDIDGNKTVDLVNLEPILPNSEIRCDYSYYLNRTDKIYINASPTGRDGRFYAKYGTPALDAIPPEDPSEGLVIGELKLIGRGDELAECKVTKKENTKKGSDDIGNLEKRVENLEYYVSLSLLEQETSNMNITDPNGLDRFKNGFVVDSFNDHGVGYVEHPDYNCAVDPAMGVLRPRYNEDNVSMEFEEEASDGLIDHEGVITLPYTIKKMASQPFSTKLVNVNPFAVFSFEGQVELKPESDEWIDTKRLPVMNVDMGGNFDEVSRMAQKAGILGTKWGAWKTSWAGVSRSRTYNTSRSFTRTKNLGSSFKRRGRIITQTTKTQTTRTTVNTQVTVATHNFKHSRDGVRTMVVPQITKKSLGDKVVDTSMIPFIRSRDVLFSGAKMKPNTSVYPFFDDVRVSEYVKPLRELVVSASRTSIKKITKHTKFYNFNKGASRLKVAGVENISSGVYRLYVYNLKGSFAITDKTLKDSRGVVIGTIQSQVDIGAFNTRLKTSAAGNVYGMFRIPNSNKLKFKTGERVFKLTSSKTNATEPMTSGEAKYTARGILQTKQKTIVSTRNAKIVERKVSQGFTSQRTVVSSRSTVSRKSWTSSRQRTWVDPLAETFMVSEKDGVFIKQIGVYFGSKDQNVPVLCQIRTVVNGYPGPEILPGANVLLYPEDVPVSEDGSAETIFEFPMPVYLKGETEYCFVIMAETVEYYMHVATMGQKTLIGDQVVSKQPYAGVMFKSQNASTWTADQTSDLKFNIYRCSFDTSKTYKAMLANTHEDMFGTRTDMVDIDGVVRTESGSSRIFVFHQFHGFDNGSIVELEGFPVNVWNGVELSRLNGRETKVSEVTINGYYIDLAKEFGSEGSNVADTTGKLNFSGIRASRNIRYDVAHPMAQQIILPNTSIDWSYISTSGNCMHGSFVPYIKDQKGTNFTIGEDIEFTTPRVIASSSNEYNKISGSNEFNRKSLVFQADMSSSSESVSPVLDTERCSVVTITNMTNYPDVNALPGEQGYVPMSTRLVEQLAEDGISPLLDEEGNIIYKEIPVDETQPFGGPTATKYVTKMVSLKDPATSLKVYVTSLIGPDSMIDIYYKTGNVSTQQEFDKLEWKLMERPEDFVSIDEAKELEFSVENLDDFSNFSFKIVMGTTNSSDVPMLKDFRGIALGT